MREQVHVIADGEGAPITPMTIELGGGIAAVFRGEEPVADGRVVMHRRSVPCTSRDRNPRVSDPFGKTGRDRRSCS